jgi:pyruvate-formate lyase
MSGIADKIYAATGLTLGAEAAAKIGQMIQQARRDALKEAAQMASNRAAAWAEDAIGKFLETKWDYESRAEASEEIASAILDLVARGEKE